MLFPLKMLLTVGCVVLSSLGETFLNPKDRSDKLWIIKNVLGKSGANAVYSISKVVSKLTEGVANNMFCKYFENIGWSNMDASSGLATYCVDLVELAKQGKIREVVGREKEIRQAMVSLAAGRCPCFIGKAGVGKSAIAEGLAIKIAKGEVPEKLKNKKIWLLNFPKLRAGNGFSTDYVSRIKTLVDSLTADRNNILFFDEVHLMAPIADYFKPAMAKGNKEGGLLVMGATTIDEYSACILKDEALHRRFSHILVEESNKEETKTILAGLEKEVKEGYQMTVSEGVFEEIVNLSDKYQKLEYFPAKAINLLNETAAYCEAQGKDVITVQDVRDYLSMKLRIPVEELSKPVAELPKE